jgi:heterodisulfide reductase subunit B
MKYLYYPGCSLHGAAADYQQSINSLCKKLDLDLEELIDWNCCGATSAVAEDQKLALTLAAINLAKCPNEDEDLVVSCNACYLRLSQVKEKFNKYPQLKEEITVLLNLLDEKKDLSKTRVKHLLQILIEDIGLERIKELVQKPLKDIKVVPYYGCQIVRPGGFDDPEQPTSLDELLKSLGAQVLPFRRKTRCCGNALIISNEEPALDMINELLAEAKNVGAQAIVVTCPVCHLNLDAFQSRVNARFNTGYNIPVVYFTQIMGVAFGISPNNLGLTRGVVSPESLLKRCV